MLIFHENQKRTRTVGTMIRYFTSRLVGLLTLALFGATAHAEPALSKYAPAVIYQYSGTDNDGTFINSARLGIEKAETEFHTKVTIVKIKNNEDLTAGIRRVANTGATPIILLGNQNVEPVLKLAKDYPKTAFTVIDGLVPPLYPNVQSILFKDNEGAFLVGMIAGKLSKTGFVGFVGGMDIPLIRNFAIGFTQGVKYGASDATVNVQMIGTTSDAWSNPDKAHAIALNQFHEGADIVFAAAGGSSLGALKAADELGKYAIGVDVNQNGRFPGHVLTSMVKRVDVAVYDTLKNSRDQVWSAGLKYLGIKEGALDYAVDQNNRALISEKLIEEVATAKDRIISGSLVVEGYTAK